MTYVVKGIIKCKEEAHARSKITDPEEGEDDHKCSGLLLTKIIKRWWERADCYICIVR